MRIDNPIVPGQFQDLLALSRHFQDEALAYDYVAVQLSHINHLPLNHFWILYSEHNEPIAYAFGGQTQLKASSVISPTDRVFQLEDIYILPQHRHKGLGRLLLLAVEQGAAAMGYTRMVLYSSIKELLPLIGFYQKHGYQSGFIQMTKAL